MNRKEYHQKYHLEHKEKQNEYSRNYYWTNREKQMVKTREWRKRTRHDYFRHESERILAFWELGNQCATCGNSDNWVLEIDHIIPLRSGKKRARESYEEILRGEKNNVQLLCANCHKRKTILEQMNNWNTP